VTHSPTFKLLRQSLKNQLWHLPKAALANLVFAFPSRHLTLIGVTGTDGKTTTASLIYHLLKKQNLPVALLSTVATQICPRPDTEEEIPSPLHTTSPNSWQLQKLLRQLSSKKIKYAVLEVTSHGLDQYRFFGCHFQVSVFTNLSHEHLDYHPNFTHYLKTKARLFLKSKNSLINLNDPHSSKLLKLISHKTKISTYGQDPQANFKIQTPSVSKNFLSFNLIYQGKSNKIKTDSPYHYQADNISAALATLSLLGFPPSQTSPHLNPYPPTPGRQEIVKNSLGFQTIFDFAHTPNGLERTLFSLKKQKPQKLIVVFSATGERDPSKRPLLGQAAARYANIGIISADDPRSENVEDIAKQIISGLNPKKSKLLTPQTMRLFDPQKFNYLVISDRQEAINFAVKIAKKGDIFISCGKGHERSITYGKTEYPWSERQAIESALQLKKR